MGLPADVAAAYRCAPVGLTAKWNQMALREVEIKWRRERSSDRNELRDAAGKNLPIDLSLKSTSDDESEWQFEVAGETRFLSEDAGERVKDFLAEYASDYERELESTILAHQPERLSRKEYLVYVAQLGSPNIEVGRAFGITEGTVAGKVGRVRRKFEDAAELLSFQDETDHFDNLEHSSFSLPSDIAPAVEPDEMPVSASVPDHGGNEYLDSRDPAHANIETFAPGMSPGQILDKSR